MKTNHKYSLIAFLFILVPYVLIFALLKKYDSEGFLIILLFPIIVFPIWRKKFKEAKGISGNQMVVDPRKSKLYKYSVVVFITLFVIAILWAIMPILRLIISG